MTTFSEPTQTFDSVSEKEWEPSPGDTTWKESAIIEGSPTDLGTALDPNIYDNATTSFHESEGERAFEKPDRFRVSLNSENVDYVVPWGQMIAQPPWTLPSLPLTPERGADCEPDGRKIQQSFWRPGALYANKVWFKITKCWIIVNATLEWEIATQTFVCEQGVWSNTIELEYSPAGSTTRTTRFATCRPRPD